MAIVSVPDCKAFRDIPADNTEHDAELKRLIEAVQVFIERECGRQFDVATVTEYHSGKDLADCIRVKRPPIVTVTNIWDDLLRAYATPLASTSWVVEDAEAGIIRLDGIAFQRGIRNIKLTYSGGFAVMPTDLMKVVIEMVWAGREIGKGNLVGVRSRSVADGSVQYVNMDWKSLSRDIVAAYSIKEMVA